MQFLRPTIKKHLYISQSSAVYQAVGGAWTPYGHSDIFENLTILTIWLLTDGCYANAPKVRVANRQ